MPTAAFDLNRFVAAQEPVHDRALAELRSGRKASHWMWFVFPQFAGLGMSAMSERFAIRSLDEARAYLAHAVLGPRLDECAETLLGLHGTSAAEIFGSPDDLKLRSSMTLFARVSPPDSIYQRVLDRYFGGAADERTLALLGERS